MKRLLKALERAGLVEMDGSDDLTSYTSMEASSLRSGAADPPPRAEPARPQPAAAPVQASLAPQPSPSYAASAPAEDDAAEPGAASTLDGEAAIQARPFEEIYAEQQLPASPFPAERLLRVLDGLAALDPVARKTAVVALDAADDSWTVDDSLLDAERKLRVLESYRSQIEQSTRAQLAAGKAAVEAREQQHQETAERIRKQIADLEALLERDVARASQDKAEIYAAARAAREALTRESARIDEEMARLRRIGEIFAPEAAATSAA